MSTTSWSESGVTYKKWPPVDGVQVGSFDNVGVGTWVEVDVTGVVTGPGVYGVLGDTVGTAGTDAFSRRTGVYGRNRGADPRVMGPSLTSAGNGMGTGDGVYGRGKQS